MNNFENAYGYDDELATGNWFTIKGIKVKLAYANSPKIEAIVQQIRNKKSDELGRELTTDEHEEVGTEIFLEHVLIDWEDKNLECTSENKKMVSKKYPHFIIDCLSKANDNKVFQEKRITEQVEK